MNHRHRILASICLTCGTVCSGVSYGQAVAGDLGRDVYESATASAASTRAQVERFIKGHTANLSGANVSLQQSARRALEAAASHSTATPSFYSVYSTAANQSLLQLENDPNMRVRLNGAIANAAIASRVGNANQTEATLAFMNDASEPVALWGVKAARYILPHTVASKQDKIAPAVMAASDNHPESGPIIEEAYDALALGFPSLPANVQPATLQAAADRVMEMLDGRLQQYQAGLPASPAADVRAVSFLFFLRVWNVLTPAEQQRAVQQLADLISLASQHAVVGGPDADLLRVLNQSGSALEVLSGFSNNPTLKEVGRTLGEGRLNDKVSGDDITKRAKAAVDALAAQFRGLKPSPQFNPGAPPPGMAPPATQPGRAPLPPGQPPRPAARPPATRPAGQR